MSHYNVHRHHRLNADETPYIFSLMYRRLWDLYEARQRPDEVAALIKVFHRFMTNQVGPPKYPKVWDEDHMGRPVLNWNLVYAQLVEWSTEMEADADTGNVTIGDNVTIREAAESA